MGHYIRKLSCLSMSIISSFSGSCYDNGVSTVGYHGWLIIDSFGDVVGATSFRYGVEGGHLSHTVAFCSLAARFAESADFNH
mmetsp:Transcript_65233/g.125956  ORF Transcript_65233/g.125956 Transcript_65233/m.125956 type:complete len:82 (+) Transcript_65233:738-983(+)